MTILIKDNEYEEVIASIRSRIPADSPIYFSDGVAHTTRLYFRVDKETSEQMLNEHDRFGWARYRRIEERE